MGSTLWGMMALVMASAVTAQYQSSGGLTGRRPAVQDYQYGGQPQQRDPRQAQGRSNVQGCIISPANIDNPLTPAREGASISITCDTDKEYDVCVFQHTQPMDVALSNSNNDLGIKCISTGARSSGQTCEDDPRLTYRSSQTQCGIQLSKSEPHDTGKWMITVGEIGKTGSGPFNSKTVTIYTFNRTSTILQDDRDTEIRRDMEVWYNYDDNKEAWRSGTGGWMNVKMSCNARGGRPEPTIRWLINNDDRNGFGDQESNADADRIFDTRDSLGNTYDQEAYIRDKLSRLTFDVNREFMDYLSSKHQIDTNPTSGTFSFDLACEVKQGDYFTERTGIRVNVRREYFRNALKGETIGMIVGIVLAVVLVIFVVLLLLFARATGRWCFADDEYGYQDPADPKRRPRTQAQR